MKTIDLSHTLRSNSPVFPGDPSPSFTQATTVSKHGYATGKWEHSSHTGTHVDVANHLFTDGPSLDWLGTDNFAGWGAVLDLSQLSDNNTDFVISPEHFSTISESDPDFILIRTGWDSYWGTEQYFKGFPSLSITTARFLAGLELKGIGLDFPSPDPWNSRDFAIHKKLFEAGLVIVENLTNLEKLPQSDFIFTAFPLKVENGDGSPVRATGLTF